MQAEGEDVPIISRCQHKAVIMATANVPQVSILVVVNTESPVGLQGGEAVVPGLQQVNSDGA